MRAIRGKGSVKEPFFTNVFSFNRKETVPYGQPLFFFKTLRIYNHFQPPPKLL